MQSRTVDRPALRLAVVAADTAAALAGLLAAREIRRHVPLPLTSGLLPATRFQLVPSAIGLTVAIQLLALNLFGFYGARVRLARSIGRLLTTVQLTQLLIFGTLLYFFQYSAYPRSVLILYLAIDFVLLYSERSFLRAWSSGRGRERALVVARTGEGNFLAETITRHSWTGIDLAGIVTTDPVPAGSGLRSVSTAADLARVIEETGSDHVLFAPEETLFRDRAIEHLVLAGRASLWVLPSAYETLIGRLRFRLLGDLPLLEVRAAPPHGILAAIKRAADIGAAAAGLILASPILLVACAAIRLISGPPVFYSQERVGKDGRPFRLWKLRTMRRDAEEKTGAILARPDDPRVTSIGRFLRASRIDEVPQLVNVLRGEMSLVGPRPERPEFVERHRREIAGYDLRFAVRPGLTGLAQVTGEYLTPPGIKLRYDLAYINSWSPGLDLLLLARTLPVILTRRGI